MLHPSPPRPFPPQHTQTLEPALLGPRVVLAYDQMLVGFAAYPEVRVWRLGFRLQALAAV